MTWMRRLPNVRRARRLEEVGHGSIAAVPRSQLDMRRCLAAIGISVALIASGDSVLGADVAMLSGPLLMQRVLKSDRQAFDELLQRNGLSASAR